MALTVRQHCDAVALKEGLLLVGGQWQQARAGRTWTHHHPATGEAVADFAVAAAEDVDDAVRAARRAFDESPWPTIRAGERARLLRRYADLLREHADDLRARQALDNSVPLSFGTVYAGSVDVAADVFEHHAGWIDKAGGETLPPYQGGDHLAMTFREPVGVVAAVLPWNAPFLLFAQKVAPALAAGCTVVLKPSEYATFCVLRLVELLREAGVPDGVINVVTGPGDPTGEALVGHPLVDKVSFTGSREVGRRIIAASADTMKRVSLELGGKSPAIVFPDADVGMAGMTAMGMVTLGLSGQACVAHSRALVHQDVYDDFLGAAGLIAASVTYGDPFDQGVLSSPLINQRQLDRVLGFIEQGQREGARLVAGGGRSDGDLSAGYFVQPTIFADVTNSMTIAQQEIFGPVLSVVPFADEDEAVRLANDSEYGLGAGVYTSDVQRAFRVAKRIRTGTVGINGFTVEPHLPFGGYKQSGLGREGGRSSFESYTELKAVLLPLSDELM
ncbi:aldehyde dehydrogenase family protein [Saccharopolyspora sp. K220]|uniref:aldehyde dehydrogenase family protein n=1 Tax=Saccharopolyspora soli TaxID=2926618 RepID=UPI001F580B96|nr:aldehyde dehydrogenase family protein [Saccharopolyspora soli]MCI2418061.1 aldehyde dehydrogenase family protein [Saccharopolyspora soli]